MLTSRREIHGLTFSADMRWINYIESDARSAFRKGFIISGYNLNNIRYTNNKENGN